MPRCRVLSSKTAGGRVGGRAVVTPSGIAWLGAVLCGGTLGGSAWCQIAQPVPVPDLTQPGPAPEQISVGSRVPPDSEAKGIGLGGFVLRPSLELGEAFDSNIYGSHSGAKSDFVTSLAPILDIGSNWNDSAVALHAEGDFSRYARYGEENRDDALLQAGGRLDISRGQYLELGAGYQVRHEDPSSPDAIAAAQAAGPGAVVLFPTPFTVEVGRIAYVYAPTRIGLELSGTFDGYGFSDVRATNGVVVINTDRDREEYTLEPKLSYAFQPGYQAFVEASGDIRTYDSVRDATALHYERSSSGYGGAIGTDFNIDRLITGRVYAGWQTQRYQDPRLPAIAGPNFGVSVLWNVTQLTSVKLSGSRQELETILAGSSGVWDTTVEASVEHELRRNLVLTVGVAYDGDVYQGIAQTDDRFDATASARWTLNRNFSAAIRIDAVTRSSTLDMDRFGRNQIAFSIRGQL